MQPHELNRRLIFLSQYTDDVLNRLSVQSFANWKKAKGGKKQDDDHPVDESSSSSSSSSDKTSPTKSKSKAKVPEEITVGCYRDNAYDVVRDGLPQGMGLYSEQLHEERVGRKTPATKTSTATMSMGSRKREAVVNAALLDMSRSPDSPAPVGAKEYYVDFDKPFDVGPLHGVFQVRNIPSVKEPNQSHDGVGIIVKMDPRYEYISKGIFYRAFIYSANQIEIHLPEVDYAVWNQSITKLPDYLSTGLDNATNHYKEKRANQQPASKPTPGVRRVILGFPEDFSFSIKDIHPNTKNELKRVPGISIFQHSTYNSNVPEYDYFATFTIANDAALAIKKGKAVDAEEEEDEFTRGLFSVMQTATSHHQPPADG